MNILVMGLPFGGDRSNLQRFHSKHGHFLRFLAADGSADYAFAATETATGVAARVSTEWPVDLFICFCPELFPPPLAIEDCPVKTVAAISDWNIYFPQLEYNLARYDVVLADKRGAQTLPLKGAKAHWVTPLYSQLGLIHKDQGIARDIDILFLGNLNGSMHPRRNHLLERIARMSDRCKVVIGEGFIDEAYAHMLNRARIVFNCSVRGEMNLRAFEATACGALVFIEEDNLESQVYLRPGEDAVYYSDSNLEERLQYYLDHEEERARIAKNGLRCIADLESIHRLDALVEWIAEQPMGPRAFKEFTVEVQEAATILQYATSLVEEQQLLSREFIADALMKRDGDPALLMSAGADVLARVLKTEGEERINHMHDALGLLMTACNISPTDMVPRLNYAFGCYMVHAAALERDMLEKVLRSTSATHGGLVLGQSSDAYYCAWRRALATPTPDVSILKSSAACRLAVLCLEAGEAAEAERYARLALTLFARAPQAYLRLADALIAQKKIEPAIAAILGGLEFAALDADYWKCAIELLRLTGAQDQAKRLLADCRKFCQVFLGDRAQQWNLEIE